MQTVLAEVYLSSSHIPLHADAANAVGHLFHLLHWSSLPRTAVDVMVHVFPFAPPALHVECWLRFT